MISFQMCKVVDAAVVVEDGDFVYYDFPHLAAVVLMTKMMMTITTRGRHFH